MLDLQKQEADILRLSIPPRAAHAPPPVLFAPEISFSGGFSLFADNGRICALMFTDCSRQLVVTFAVPVSGISFFTADEGAGYSAVEISVIRDGVTLALFESPVDGNTLTTDFHDLSSYTGVTRLLLTPVGAGLGMNFDDFRFTDAGEPPAAISEPSSWPLLIAGLGLLGVGRRQRSRVTG